MWMDGMTELEEQPSKAMPAGDLSKRGISREVLVLDGI